MSIADLIAEIERYSYYIGLRTRSIEALEQLNREARENIARLKGQIQMIIMEKAKHKGELQ